MEEDNNQNKEPVIREIEERLPRRWPLLLLYAVLALIVAIVVVFGVRALYRHEHPAPKKTPSITTKQPVKRPTFTSSPSSTPKTSTTSNPNLPNSGPGQVVGLFIGSAMAAGGLHYLVNYQRRSHRTN